jgi:hypothetical protein
MSAFMDDDEHFSHGEKRVVLTFLSVWTVAWIVIGLLA